MTHDGQVRQSIGIVPFSEESSVHAQSASPFCFGIRTQTGIFHVPADAVSPRGA